MAVICLFAGLGFGQQKYAILVSAEPAPTVDDLDYHSEFWYDLFLMYRMLTEDGFTHNRIYVLFADGNDFASGHTNFQTGTVFPGVAQITDYPNRKADVANIFTWLANGNAAEGIPQIQDNDFLFYWWMGHGGGCACADYIAYIHHADGTTETISDNEFDAYFAQLPACTMKAEFVMTCRSGGIIEELEGLHSPVHTAAECCQNAYIHQTECHAEFNYHLFNAFRQVDPYGNAIASDTSGDGLVSVEETNVYVHANTTQSNSQISDYRGIGPLILIANADPDAGVPDEGVYSRDYAEDNGTEPSDHLGHIWYHGPDLWVRHAQDGQTDHQDPEFGQTNYVYARIHNIGCTTLNATADLSWCDVSAWASPASWNSITPVAVAVNNLQSSESRDISAAWTTVPAPGTYCLHTVLNSPGDPANADGRAYMDNNKVQINVDVKDSYSGYTSNFHWFIENGLKKAAKVDVVISNLKVPTSAKVVVRIPTELKFERLSGGRLKKMREFSGAEIPSRTRKVVIQGVLLQPLEKKEAILSVVMPQTMKRGESILVKASEQLDGREMGGIVFETRSASRREVFTGVLRRTENLFGVLGKKFGVRGSDEIVKLCQSLQKDDTIGDKDSLKKIRKVIELEARTRDGISKLMDARDFARFDAALKAVEGAIEKQDAGAFVEWQEELIWASRPIFLKLQK
jgi:hypothetical protein